MSWLRSPTLRSRRCKWSSLQIRRISRSARRKCTEIEFGNPKCDLLRKRSGCVQDVAVVGDGSSILRDSYQVDSKHRPRSRPAEACRGDPIVPWQAPGASGPGNSPAAETNSSHPGVLVRNGPHPGWLGRCKRPGPGSELGPSKWLPAGNVALASTGLPRQQVQSRLRSRGCRLGNGDGREADSWLQAIRRGLAPRSRAGPPLRLPPQPARPRTDSPAGACADSSADSCIDPHAAGGSARETSGLGHISGHRTRTQGPGRHIECNRCDAAAWGAIKPFCRRESFRSRCPEHRKLAQRLRLA